MEGRRWDSPPGDERPSVDRPDHDEWERDFGTGGASRPPGDERPSYDVPGHKEYVPTEKDRGRSRETDRWLDREKEERARLEGHEREVERGRRELQESQRKEEREERRRQELIGVKVLKSHEEFRGAHELVREDFSFEHAPPFLFGMVKQVFEQGNRREVKNWFTEQVIDVYRMGEEYREDLEDLLDAARGDFRKKLEARLQEEIKKDIEEGGGSASREEPGAAEEKKVPRRRTAPPRGRPAARRDVRGPWRRPSRPRR